MLELLVPNDGDPPVLGPRAASVLCRVAAVSYGACVHGGVGVESHDTMWQRLKPEVSQAA